MLEIVASNQFRRDLKTLLRQGCNMDLLDQVIQLLAEQKPLPRRNADHPLTGNFAGCRECHIAPDWILIYKIKKDVLELYLMSTGTHSDLYKK